MGIANQPILLAVFKKCTKASCLVKVSKKDILRHLIHICETSRKYDNC